MRSGWPCWAVLLLILSPGALSRGDAVFTIDPEAPVAGSPVALDVTFAGDPSPRDVRILEVAEGLVLTDGVSDLHVHLPAQGLATLHVRIPGANAVLNATGALPSGVGLITGPASAIGREGDFSIPVFFPSAGAWNVSVVTDAGARTAVVRVPEGPGLVATATGGEGSTLLALRNSPGRFHVGEEVLSVAVFETRDFVAYRRLGGVTAVASAVEAATGARVPDTPLAASDEGLLSGRFGIPFPGTWEIRVNVTHPDFPVARILAAGPVSRLPIDAVFESGDDRSWRSTASFSMGTYAVLAHGPAEDIAWAFDVGPAPRPFVAISGSARANPGVPFDLALFVAKPDGEPMAGARDVEAIARDAAGNEVVRATLAPDGASYRWRGLALPEKGGYSVHVSSASLGLAPGEADAARLEAGPPPDSKERDPPPVPPDPGVNPLFLLVAAVFLAGAVGLSIATLRKR